VEGWRGIRLVVIVELVVAAFVGAASVIDVVGVVTVALNAKSKLISLLVLSAW